MMPQGRDMMGFSEPLAPQSVVFELEISVTISVFFKNAKQVQTRWLHGQRHMPPSRMTWV